MYRNSKQRKLSSEAIHRVFTYHV